MKYCFDLDGTLCDTPSDPDGHNVRYWDSTPIPFMVGTVYRLYNEGNRIISEPSISTAGGNYGDGGGPFSKLDRLVQLEPEVRLDLINKFKEFIKSGEYKIDPDEVASKMISDALEEDLA